MIQDYYIHTEREANILVQIEEELLGGLFFTDSDTIAGLATKLPKEAFYISAHRTLYQTIISLNRLGEPVAPNSIALYLAKKGNLFEIGGQAKIAQLLQQTIGGDISWCVRKILEAWQKRQAAGQAGKLQSLLQDPQISVEEAIATTLSELQAIAPSADNPDERLRLEIKAFQQESDPIRRVRLKGKICSHYRISNRDLAELATELESASNTPKAKRYKGSDFLGLESEGLSWLIPGLLPARGCTLLSGMPGAGKTTIAYDAAACILTGDEFLSEEPTRTGNVLIVSSDELPCFSQDKLIERGFPADGWDFISDWDVSQWLRLEEAIEDVRPALIVIDSFAKIHGNPEFDENSAAAKTTVYKLETLLNKYSCAAILIHHNNKRPDAKGVGRVRGNTAIAAAASVVWLLEGEGNIKNFSTPKIRGAEPRNLKISLQIGEGRWNVVESDSDDSMKSLANRLLTFFNSQRSGIRLEVSEIMELMGLHTNAKDALYKALQRLQQRGQLIKRPSHRDPRAKVYGLPNIRENNTDINTVTESGTSYFPLSPPPTRLKVSSIISKTIATHTIEDTGQILDKILDTYWTPENQENTETLTKYTIEDTGQTHADRGGEGVSCDSCDDNLNEMIQTDIITEFKEYQNADVLLDEPAKDDLELLAADLLNAIERRDRELFEAIREFFPLKWVELAAYQLGFKPHNFYKIFDWFK